MLGFCVIDGVQALEEGGPVDWTHQSTAIVNGVATQLDSHFTRWEIHWCREAELVGRRVSRSGRLEDVGDGTILGRDGFVGVGQILVSKLGSELAHKDIAR